jgi:peptidyl-tRNA hydrolase, PTH1 family
MNKYLIVGLGNIGEKYGNTRHNIGFLIVDKLVQKLGGTFKSQNFGQLCETSYKGRKTYILKPDTYMNLSGNSVKYWVIKEKIKLENCLIICDDLSLPFGIIRIKSKGSSAGHNGLKSIEGKLDTQLYPRFRFGIGNNYLKGKQIEYVLGEWNEDEKKVLNERIDMSSEAILSFIFSGLSYTMNQYNGK